MTTMATLVSQVDNKLASVGISIPGDAEKVEWMNDGGEEFAVISGYFYATGTDDSSSSSNSYTITDFMAAAHGDLISLLAIWYDNERMPIKSWGWLRQQEYYKWRSQTASTPRWAYQDSQDTFSLYFPSNEDGTANIRVGYSWNPARKTYVGATTGTWYTEAVDYPREIHRHLVNYTVGWIFLKMGEEVKGQAFISVAVQAFEAFAIRHRIEPAEDVRFTQPEVYST